MILRHVYIKLKDAKDRGLMVDESHRLLGAAPGVLSLTVETPADDVAEKAWDVALTIRFDTLEDVEAYRVHKLHEDYMDVLRPRLEVIKAWNFNVA